MRTLIHPLSLPTASPAGAVLEGDAPGLVAQDALNVIAVVQLVVKAGGDAHGAGRVAVLDDNQVVGLEKGAPAGKEWFREAPLDEASSAGAPNTDPPRNAVPRTTAPRNPDSELRMGKKTGVNTGSVLPHRKRLWDSDRPRSGHAPRPVPSLTTAAHALVGITISSLKRAIYGGGGA